MPKRKYRVINWPEYNRSLVRRGSIALWLTPEAAQDWLSNEMPHRQGRRKKYSDQAIYSLMCIKSVFRLTYRALEGMAGSLMQLSGFQLPIPSYQQIQRRAAQLQLSRKVSKKQPTDIVIDASGVKIYGEGEWQQERGKRGNRKQWKKIHIAVDPDSGEIIMEEVTDSNCHDSVMLPALLKGCSRRTKHVYADGAYDTERCYTALHKRGITPHIPPRRGSVVRGHKHMRARDEAIRGIINLGGDEIAIRLWKKLTRYGRRSLVEAAFARFKRAFGKRAWSKKLANLKVEMNLKWRILNRFSNLGRCISYAI